MLVATSLSLNTGSSDCAGQAMGILPEKLAAPNMSLATAKLPRPPG